MAAILLGADSMRALATTLLVSIPLMACGGRSHDPGAAPPCDLEAAPGETCLGDWTCTSEIEGSTATFVYQHRCEDGLVVVDELERRPHGFPDPPPDAGVAPIPDSGVVLPPPPDMGIRCGDSTCVAGSEVCVGCSGDGDHRVYCAPMKGEDFFTVANREFGRGCGFPSVFVECNEEAHCAAGKVCLISEGEFGYALCADGEENPYGHVCTASSDCGGEWPVCRDVGGLGYFTQLAETLGWAPRTCQRDT